jgi:F-type H+-transporting ATPase subunit gamma
MANLKDIRKRIVTVKNTQKITRVMTMISAAKLHKAKQNIDQSRPYHAKLKDVFFFFV